MIYIINNGRNNGIYNALLRVGYFVEGEHLFIYKYPHISFIILEVVIHELLAFISHSEVYDVSIYIT